MRNGARNPDCLPFGGRKGHDGLEHPFGGKRCILGLCLHFRQWHDRRILLEFLTFYAICAAISLLGGILLSFYFFRRNCYPVQTLENLFAPEKAPSEEPRQTGEIGTIIRQIRDLPEYNVQQESRLKQAILGQALRGRSPRSSRKANRSPTALHWPTAGRRKSSFVRRKRRRMV